MPTLPPELEEIYGRALDELFALGRNLPRASFRLMAEKYDLKEYTLRMKYWKRTDEKPSPFLRTKGLQRMAKEAVDTVPLFLPDFRKDSEEFAEFNYAVVKAYRRLTGSES